ncbi:hypothetical protein TanjilG_06200 [Lupinus angustifolius]|uniref:Exonuclease domain-containing protein n=1 Tax=Lupinus angustifolius TaxID=3871 RepID=A0A1J7GK73_LUPAN|nr:hypothetical protein TanjilG_06200 [Lupinus angustifolius]
MEEMIDTTKKKVLIDIVRLVQKRGLKGKLGDWKEFLDNQDRKFGSNLSDPSKRSHEVLASFLKTFHEEDHLKFLFNVMQQHSNREVLEQLKDKSYDSPEQGWEVINLEDINKAIRYTSMVSIDCEMVSCEDGTEALVEVCIVDRNLEVKLHERVKPNKAIADYRTDITGVSSKDLDGVTCTLADIQAVLGYDVREKGATHSCVDDARAAMKLVLAKIEHGVDRAIHLIEEPIPESEMAKLLLHGIPTSVNSEELHNVLPGDFTIELKISKKGRGEKYSAFAIFKNPQEALQAYENVQGNPEKDTANRPQKLVKFKLRADKTASLYVRKMAPDDNHDQIPCKRALQVDDDAFDVSKKAKVEPESNECDIDALKNEIEALRQQLKEKDMLIETLQKQKDFGIYKVHNKRVPQKKRKRMTR